MKPAIKVGVGVLVFRNNLLLLGKRINAHGHNTWAFPGGNLEYREDPLQCAMRETKEETGLSITNLKVGPFTSDIFEIENKHYITLFVFANSSTGEPKILEPNKCLAWEWFKWDELPQPLFKPITSFFQKTTAKEITSYISTCYAIDNNSTK